MSIAVNLWGSHPEANNDDLWTGVAFASREAALAAIESGSFPFPAHSPSHIVAFFEIIIEDENEATVESLSTHENPAHKSPAARRQRRSDDSAERSEFQMQQAMGHGVQGWNDFEGM